MIPSRDGVIECLVNDIFYTFVCCNSFRFYQRTAQPNEQGPIICWNLSIALTLDSFFYKNKRSPRVTCVGGYHVTQDALYFWIYANVRYSTTI